MKKNILPNIDPFHDEIEIDRNLQIDYGNFSEYKETSIGLTEQLKEHNNYKDITQNISKDKIKNIPHEARYSIQLEKTKALNAQHGSLFFKSPKDDHRYDLPLKISTLKSLNITNSTPKQCTSSEAINEEFFKRLNVNNECEPTVEIKNIKNKKSRKLKSARNFFKNKSLAFKKNNTKSSNNLSNLALTMKDIIKEIITALFSTEEFVKKFKNLISITIEDSNTALQNQNVQPKLICDSDSNKNNVKKTENADLTDFNVSIFKTRYPETIIHELIESIKERYTHHTNLPDKFIFPIIYDEPANIIHKYEFLTYETYLKTSISTDPDYKIIYSNRNIIQSNSKVAGKKPNTNDDDESWDDDEDCLVINESASTTDTSLKSQPNSVQNLTNNTLENLIIPNIVNNIIPEQTESTIERISVHESQNRETPHVNIILKAPNMMQLPEATAPVNLCSNSFGESQIHSTPNRLQYNLKTKLTNLTCDNKNGRSPKIQRLDQNNKSLNYNEWHTKQIGHQASNDHKRSYKKTLKTRTEYNKISTVGGKTKHHNTELTTNCNYVGTENNLEHSLITNKKSIIKNPNSNLIGEQMHLSSMQYNHQQQPMNLMLGPPPLNNNRANGHGLPFKPQNSQNNILTSHPKYSLMPNNDTRILEHRLQKYLPQFQQPFNLAPQTTKNTNFIASTNNSPQVCKQVNSTISHQSKVSTNLDRNSQIACNELGQYQQNAKYHPFFQLDYPPQAHTAFPNNRQQTISDNYRPALNPHSSAVQNHVYQQNYYYDGNDRPMLNYNNQNYQQQQFLPQNGSNSRSVDIQLLKPNMQ